MISVVKSAPPPRTAVRNKRLCTGQRPEVVPRADLQEETSPRRTGWSKREGVSGVGAGRACQAQRTAGVWSLTVGRGPGLSHKQQ